MLSSFSFYSPFPTTHFPYTFDLYLAPPDIGYRHRGDLILSIYISLTNTNKSHYTLCAISLNKSPIVVIVLYTKPTAQRRQKPKYQHVSRCKSNTMLFLYTDILKHICTIFIIYLIFTTTKALTTCFLP